MQIDPNSVQWDQTPAPATQGGKSGGVIITDTSKVNADAREAERLRLAQEAEARNAAKEGRDIAEFEGTAGKPTEAQGKAATMLTRIEGNMADIQDIVSKFPDQQTPGLKETMLYNSLGNDSIVARNTTDWQRRAIRDAQMDMVDALLTLGTGAAYTPEQLAGQVTAYFPQYGDKPEEIEYKQRRLQRLILAAKAQAGPLAPKLEAALGPLMAGAAPEQGGGGEGPRITVTEEESAKAWGGEPIYDEIGNPVGLNYEGMGYDKSGKEIGLVGRVTGEGKQEDSSLLGDIKETVTGEERSTPEIEALPDWVTMPELNELSLKGFKVGAGTLLSGPEETARIIQAQFPDVRVRQDSKGNFILKSSDGQEYAIKPGFRWSDAPRAIGAIAAFTPAGRAESILGASVGAAGTQALVEGSQAAAGGSFDPEDVALAGAGGAVGKVAEKGLGVITGQAPKIPSAIRPEADKIIQSGKDFEVPVMTSDVRPPKTWIGKWTQSMGEKVPFVGTGGKRASQQEAREAAITKLYDDAQAGDTSIDDVTADFIATRGAQVGKLVDQKKAVFNKIGPAPVDTRSALSVIDGAIAKYGDKEAYAPLVGKLKSWRRDLTGSDIKGVELLRKAIGDSLNDESLTSVRSELRNTANEIYPELRKDMGEHIKKFGEAADFMKWQDANSQLSDFATELENSTLSRVLRNGNATPEEASSLLFSKKPSEVRALYNNLSETGKQNARSLVIQNIVEKAGGVDDLSTAKFTTALKNSGSQIGIIFPKAETERLTGMLRLYRATREAERAAVSTPTGQSTIPLVGALAGVFTGPKGVAMLGTLGSLPRVYESAAMRNLLVSLARVREGSKAESNIIANIGKVLAKAAPPAAVAEGQ